MPPKKINVKERFSDGEIDLSMSDLQEVPVKDIAVFRKTFSLDLSNNFLVALPTTFAALTNLTKLDLSKNQLKELPDNFGELTKLRHLDLYQNQLEYLPLSFSKLKSLKWLDLKDNPLVPAVAKVAGPCLVTKDCEKCARDVVNVFSNLHEQIENDKETRKKNQQKQLEINQQKEMELKKNKKKEKSKLGKKEANGPLPVKPLHKKNKKHDKKPQGKTVVSPSSSGLKLLFTSVIVVFISLFVATSTKCSYTKNVEVAVTDLYVQGVNVLPPNLQEYSISAGNYVRFVHNKTGNFTLEAVNYLQNKENYVKAYNALGEVIERLLHKVKEQYNQFVS